VIRSISVRYTHLVTYPLGVAERVGVLVLPGMGASDRSTIAIRLTLASQGCRVHRWKLGRNRPTPELQSALRSRFFDVAERYESPIALVGWSLGGLYAHRLTEFAPNLVRSVITLGSPLNEGTRLPSLPVPPTSIYSRKDRVVSWSKSLVDARIPRHENVEVRSTHLTLGIDPAVMLVISDRLRTDPDCWKPFQAPPLMGPVYPGPGTNNAT
jgi:pimeloyl-ACP methyl ester carboxylesterase